jgi:hypothetical protein
MRIEGNIGILSESEQRLLGCAPEEFLRHIGRLASPARMDGLLMERERLHAQMLTIADHVAGLTLITQMRRCEADIKTFAGVAGPLLVHEIEWANDMPHQAAEHPLGLE